MRTVAQFYIAMDIRVLVKRLLGKRGLLSREREEALLTRRDDSSLVVDRLCDQARALL